MKIEHTYINKKGQQVAFDRVIGARILNGMPAYILWNGETIEFQKYNKGYCWAETRTNTVCIPVLNRFTGEVYGFMHKEVGMPSEILVNSRMREV